MMMMGFQVNVPSSTNNAAHNKNINSAPPRQPRRRISLEDRRSSFENDLQQVHHQSIITGTTSRQRRDSLEKRGSIEIHPSATRRRSSGDSFANYSYQDLITAINVVQRFVEHDSLDRMDYFEFSEDDDEGDLNDCSSCGSVSSLDATEAEEELDDGNDDICCTDTAVATIEEEEVTASSSVDDTACDDAGAATMRHSKGVQFATYAHVREYSITMQANVDNACYLCLSWECTKLDHRVPVRNVPSKTIRRLTLNQREKRLAQVTGLSLDEIYQMEEDLLLQEIKDAMARAGKQARVIEASEALS